MLRRWRAPAMFVGVAAMAVAAVLLRPAPETHPWTPPLRPAIDGVLTLPNETGSIRFAVMGDVGRGDQLQYETAEQLTRWHEQFPFTFVLLLGDNIYGPGTADDLALRFERPYRSLLDREVSFRAVPGNHDPPSILSYPPLGMNGHRYYGFAESGGTPLHRTRADFFALDTVALDGAELRWLMQGLEASTADWQIAFYHHPLYTSGDYGWRAGQLRAVLEPIFVRGGIDVGFNGHEHFYERVVPQQGVQYFTSGAGGALRQGVIRRSSILATGFDQDTHFMLVELGDETMHFQVISRTGATVDYGDVSRKAEKRETPRLR